MLFARPGRSCYLTLKTLVPWNLLTSCLSWTPASVSTLGLLLTTTSSGATLCHVISPQPSHTTLPACSNTWRQPASDVDLSNSPANSNMSCTRGIKNQCPLIKKECIKYNMLFVASAWVSITGWLSFGALGLEFYADIRK